METLILLAQKKGHVALAFYDVAKVKSQNGNFLLLDKTKNNQDMSNITNVLSDNEADYVILNRNYSPQGLLENATRHFQGSDSKYEVCIYDKKVGFVIITKRGGC